MRVERNMAFDHRAISRGILVLQGYGIRVVVERGHLVVSDGTCNERLSIRLHRASCGLKRLVILGHSGLVSLDALRWLHDIKAGFAIIDADGGVITAFGPAGLNDARLRRAQVVGASNGVGLRVTAYLLKGKILGQAEVVDRLGAGQTAASLRRTADTLDEVATLERLRVTEAACAADYWKAWELVPVVFARRDESRVPNHWRTFGTRSSPLTGQPRLAANPANALLNYLYSVLETEASIACQAMGLDPGMGILHADQPARDSMALDLMEAVRSQVDAFLLEVLHTQTFAKQDFIETRQGVCRVLPPLTQFLAQTAPRWASAVAPIVERVAHILLAGTAKRVARSFPTPLTQLNRSAGRVPTKRSPRHGASPRQPGIPSACKACGVILNTRKRQYCAECFPKQRTKMIASWSEAGLKTLADRRAAGRDAAHGGRAGYRRGKRNAEHIRAAKEWKREHGMPQNERDFWTEVLPRLENVPLRGIARATGFSLAYCSFIRRGLRMPHPRHWDDLRAIGRANSDRAI